MYEISCWQYAYGIDTNGETSIFSFSVSRIMSLTFLVVWLVCIPLFVFASSDPAESNDSLLGSLTEFWLFRLFLNLCGYATIVVPGYLLIQYLKRSNYIEKSSKKSFLCLSTDLSIR